jgi:ribosomal protein S18 acetylase RimI-like enzyme
MGFKEEDFIIRAATSNDVAVLAKVGSETFYQTFRPYNTETDMQLYIQKTYSLQQMELNLADNTIHYFLCECKQACMGYIKLVEGSSYPNMKNDPIELEKIYVYQSYFGTPASRLLMNKAIDVVKHKGYQTMFLGVWEENKRAINFYQKHGFKKVATRQFKLGDTICDDWIMELAVQQ